MLRTALTALPDAIVWAQRAVDLTVPERHHPSPPPPRAGEEPELLAFATLQLRDGPMRSPDTTAETAERRLRSELVALHQELVRWGLVAWTAGNVSALVPGTGTFLIKPSGVSYDELRPQDMVLCDLDGALVRGEHRPSSDTAAHAYVYRHRPGTGGVVHTHSPYACGWAARQEAIPCVLTAIADEFGGPIPVGPFAMIGDDSIGRGIVETLRGSRSPAVLMANHGVFSVGRDARAAVKAAVMCEDAARSVHLARQGGPVVPIPPEAVDALHHRYQNAYGQSSADVPPAENEEPRA